VPGKKRRNQRLKTVSSHTNPVPVKIIVS